MSKPYDATTKDLLEADPDAWLDYLQVPRRGTVRLINADLSTVTTEADKVLHLDAPQPALVHVELQAARDPELAERILRYNVLLSYRHKLPVLSLAVLLRPEADGPELTGTHTARWPDGSEYLRFSYRVVRTWHQPVEAVLRGGLGTLPLAPLADAPDLDAAEVLRRVAERLSRETEPAEGLRLWTATTLLLGLRHGPEAKNDLIGRVLGMKLLGINGIEESSVYQLILARGKAEGKAEGIAEGEAKGRAEEARRIVLLLGEKRFGPPGAEVVAAIERLTDPGQVEALIKRLDEVPGWDELLNGPRSA